MNMQNKSKGRKVKRRKPSPAVPHYYWTDSDNCWWCSNRSNCANCKKLKEQKYLEQIKRKKREINKLRRGDYESYEG